MSDKSTKNTSYLFWLIAVAIASGFGNICVEIAKELIADARKTASQLEYVDASCWHKSFKGKKETIGLCSLVFKNIGDLEAVVTSIEVDATEKSQSFESNFPGGQRMVEADFYLSGIAVVPSDQYLVIRVGIDKKFWPKAAVPVCLLKGKETLVCHEVSHGLGT